MDPENIPATFEVRSFTSSWDNSDWTFRFGVGLRTQSWGTGGLRGSGWYGSKERWWVPGLRSNFSSTFTRFRDIVTSCSPARHFFPNPPLVSPKFLPVPLGVGGWPFGYKERRHCVLLSLQLVSKIPNLRGPDPPTSQTDGQTDGQTDRRTDDMQSRYRALHSSASRDKN